MKFRFTCRTQQHEPSVFSFLWIEDTFSPFAVTICAEIMRRFGIAHAFFQSISNNSSIPQVFQVIAFLFGLPCFEIHNFFFKIAYFLNHRRLLRLGGKSLSLYRNQVSGCLSDSRINSIARFQLKNTIDDITGGFDPGDCSGDTSNVHVKRQL